MKKLPESFVFIGSGTQGGAKPLSGETVLGPEPEGPPPPSDFTNDTFWENNPAKDGTYTWNDPQWENDGSGGNGFFSFGLRAIGAWPPVTRKNTFIIRTNSGPMNFDGFLFGTSFALLNTNGDTIASANVDYNSYNETIQLDLPIDNSGNLDYDRIDETTFLYNGGAIIDFINFTD